MAIPGCRAATLCLAAYNSETMLISSACYVTVERKREREREREGGERERERERKRERERERGGERENKSNAKPFYRAV